MSDHQDLPFIVLFVGAVFLFVVGWGAMIGTIAGVAVGAAIFSAGWVLLATTFLLDPHKPILDNGEDRSKRPLIYPDEEGPR